MVAWNNGNVTRSNGWAPSWMGTKGRDHIPKTPVEVRFHQQFGPDGPTTKQLQAATGPPEGHNEEQRIRLLGDLERMRYTRDGEGCRLLDGAVLGTPKPNPPASNAVEAAEAMKYYPDIPNKIMDCALKISTDFPVHRVKFGKAVGLEGVALMPEILILITGELSYTDRASLFGASTTLAYGMNSTTTCWSANGQDLRGAELTLDEWLDRCARGDPSVDPNNPPRVPGTVMIANTVGEYNPDTGRSDCGSWLDIGYGTVRVARALRLGGEAARAICLNKQRLVDRKVLAGLIESCPNLEWLEYIGCGNSSLFDIIKILKHLEWVQKHRGTYIRADLCPVFFKGPKYINKRLENTCYGVTNSQPGVDLATSVFKLMLYDLAPAAKAAGQMHMLTDMSATCRQYLEALPLPKDFVPLMLKAWEYKDKMNQEIAKEEKVWMDRQIEAQNASVPILPQAAMPGLNQMPQPPAPPAPAPDLAPFKYKDWSDELHNKVDLLNCQFLWFGVRACFGDNGYKTTQDRGAYACTYKCTAGNYKEWAKLMLCITCEETFPRFLFNSGNVCEGCHLRQAILDEDDHCENEIRLLTEQLGFGSLTSDYVSNKKSNIPFDKFLPGRVRNDREFKGVVSSNMPTFVWGCNNLDWKPPVQDFSGLTLTEARAARKRKRALRALANDEDESRGRLYKKQRRHQHEDTPDPNERPGSVWLRHRFMLTLSHAQHAQAKDGWAPGMAPSFE